MISFLKIVDEAANMIKEDGIKIYKTTCPRDFARPSYFISAVLDNTTFDTDVNMLINLTLMITVFERTDVHGNCDALELLNAAMRLKNKFASIGGIYVDDNFLQINNIKSEFGLDTVNMALTVQYMDIPDIEIQEYDIMQDVSIKSNVINEEGE